jgi:hypothetical protein
MIQANTMREERCICLLPGHSKTHPRRFLEAVVGLSFLLFPPADGWEKGPVESREDPIGLKS